MQSCIVKGTELILFLLVLLVIMLGKKKERERESKSLMHHKKKQRQIILTTELHRQIHPSSSTTKIILEVKKNKNANYSNIHTRICCTLFDWLL